MRCVKCDKPISQLGTPCPYCHFDGAPILVEELLHIQWLLAEFPKLAAMGIHATRLEQYYAARRRELEAQLGLRLPSLTPAQLRGFTVALAHNDALLRLIQDWSSTGWIRSEQIEPILVDIRSENRELNRQLEGHLVPPYPESNAERLDVVEFLLAAVQRIGERNGFVSEEVQGLARASVQVEKDKLEIQLRLRKRPAPAAPPKEQERVQAPRPAAATAPVPPSPPVPPVPLVDRFWKTLLSERTLQAMLFLGIFLLLSAAVSFVIWGWEEFSAPLRVAIPTGFTIVFLGLGWYIRAQTRMYRSGIAVTAVAALLIPIDFYTLYANFNIPPEKKPLFWFITSLACLGAYLVITWSTQSALFGYLVGAAAGGAVLSLVEIGHQYFALAQDWDAAALSLVVVELLLIGTALSTPRESRWRVLAEPMCNLALIGAGAIMPLTFGWRYIDRKTYDALHYSMTLSWWLGGLVFGWGAIHYRSRTLGVLTAIALPVATFMAQAAWFDQARISPAWHAFGLALLVPIYLIAGRKFLAHANDKVLHGHGRTATGWGIALAVIAAIWSLTNLTSSASAAATHAVLSGAALLAVFLWKRPRLLYTVALFTLTSSAFTMTELGLAPAQFSIGWASLSILFIVLAVFLGTRRHGSENAEQHDTFAERLTAELVNAGFVIAALALVPSLVPYDGNRLAYALGNWLGLTSWAAWRAHTGQPGFAARGRLGISRFHWLTALPLPTWILVLFANRGPLGSDLPLALSALAWGMVAMSYRLRESKSATVSSQDPSSGQPPPASSGEGVALHTLQRLAAFVAVAEDAPWYVVGLGVSLLAPIAAVSIDPTGYSPAICLLASGLLYLLDALWKRQRGELVPGAWVVAWAWAWLLDRAGVPFDAVTLCAGGLIAVYIGAGLWTEHRRSRTYTRHWIAPLYWASHVLTLVVLLRSLNAPLVSLLYRVPWTEEMQLWQAASLTLLGGVYALYAWGTLQERWAHAAAWLLAGGGGLVAISHSTGSGRLAAEAAAGAMAYVLFERALFRLRRTDRVPPRGRAYFRLACRLYRRPLLVAGWTISFAAIGLALVRNLILLDAGRTQQIWTAISLTMIVGLYALSARMFRQARFVWLAAFLAFVPWTIMTNLGWLVGERPRTAAFALSWMVLAWLANLIALFVRRLASAAYASPLRVFAHLLVPFFLLWGIADADTSRLTYALAVAFYTLEAIREARQLKQDANRTPSRRHTAFLYPALGLVPIWSIYALNLLPGARHEHYGLMLLAFGLLGLIMGQWLERIAPHPEMARSYGLPAYLTGNVAVVVGTLLVAHDAGLLSLALLYDALLMVVSARLFKHPLWAFAAAATMPFSFWLALNQSGIPGNRHGWWLLALAGLYLLIAWALRRARLLPYSTAPLAIGFALIAFGLPPSSQDKVGAFWGYGSAAILYAASALWLRQPLLLTPACALALVPYAVGLQESPISSQHYGLVLFPLALISLALGWLMETRWGAWKDFPWNEPRLWPIALAERLLGWWGLPFYALAFGLAVASTLYTDGSAALAALNCLCAMPLGLWAIYRFRLRGWLVATVLAGHAAALLYLYDLGWSRYSADLALRFLPVTLLTALVALAIERRRKETPPMRRQAMSFGGWSHPLYFVVLCDVLMAQILGLSDANAGWLVSLVHALLVAALGSLWLAGELPPVSAVLGIVALVQYMTTQPGPVIHAPIPLAQLALGYGIVGCALAFWRERRSMPAGLAIWERSLEWSGLLLSGGVLVLAAVLGLNIAQWTVRALVGLPFRQIVDMPTVQMLVGVLALLGLLYLAAAFVHRRPRAGYVAVAILLVAWSIHAFYVQAWDGAANVQWYALPAGVYLLGVSFLEHQRTNVNLARWIDYAAVVLMMGSLFWQTLLFGWGHALMLGAEGFGALWWGSARRLRRFLYAGMMGVVLATLAQLINSLQSVNQWVVFGTIGLVVVLTAIFVERKMEEIKAFRQVLETWE